MKAVLSYLWERRTTVLGYVVTVLGVLATSNKFDSSTVEWFVLTIGIITALLGHGNNVILKRQELSSKQSGFARPLMLAFLLAVSVSIIVLPLSGCTNMTRAVRNADTPADYALIFLAGYDSALKTANQYRQEGRLTAEDLDHLRNLESKAYPFVQPIPKLQRAYEESLTATDAETLQRAVDDAILAAAEFIRAVQILGQELH